LDIADHIKYSHSHSIPQPPLISNNEEIERRIGICGRSAGGMLIGSCVNMKSDLFDVAIMEVPFVDCLNTMSGF